MQIERSRERQEPEDEGEESDIMVSEMQAPEVVPHPGSPEESELRFKVTQNPGGTFYKDEGGKANHLVASVVLEGSKGVALNGKVGVTARLCYENGREVEDGADIFKVLTLEPRVVTSTDQKVTVKFRIEKVSRRKDGQRFKVRFETDPSQSYCHIKPVFTSPICVLSKRKFPTNQNVNSQKTAPLSNKKVLGIKRKGNTPINNNSNVPSTNGNLRRGSVPVTKAEFAVEDMVLMRKTIAMLEAQVSSLTERVLSLEDESTTLRETLKRNRQEFHENLKSYGNAASNVVPLVQPADNKFKIPGDYTDADLLCSIDDFDPRPFKRTASTNVTFDFGVPSSLVDSPFY